MCKRFYIDHLKVLLEGQPNNPFLKVYIIPISYDNPTFTDHIHYKKSVQSKTCDSTP